jgi:hypothetical protein
VKNAERKKKEENRGRRGRRGRRKVVDSRFLDYHPSLFIFNSPAKAKD